jgi:hypothetical protein
MKSLPRFQNHWFVIYSGLLSELLTKMKQFPMSFFKTDRHSNTALSIWIISLKNKDGSMIF